MNPKEQRLKKLTSKYDELCGRINRLNDFISSINFEDIVEDAKEQILMIDQYLAMCRYLKARIRILLAQIKHDAEIKDWTELKPNARYHVAVDVSTDGGHHCGQDADMDDACCQAREKRPVGDDSAVVNEIPDSIKSLEGMQVIKVCGPKCKDCPCGDGLREYPSGRDASSCVKVELVGGYYLCLAPLPNSIVTE